MVLSIVSELVGQVLRVELWLFGLFALALLLLASGSRRWGWRALALGVLGWTLAAVLPVGQLLIAPLESRYQSRPDVSDADGIILQGGAEDLGATRHWGMPQLNGNADRYFAVLELAARLPEVPVLVTGGGAPEPGAPTEAGIAAALLAAGGIAPDRMVFEADARNTVENATALAALGVGKDGGRWILVTSAFHMPRAVEAFCAADWTGIVPWPTDYKTRGKGWGWAPLGNLGLINIALSEAVGTLGYRVLGKGRRPADGDCLAST